MRHLDKLTHDSREPRNLIARHVGYSEPELDKLHSFLFVLEGKPLDPDPIKYRPWAKQLADEFVTSRKALLRTTIQRLESCVDAVLEPLAEVVEARLTSLDG